MLEKLKVMYESSTVVSGRKVCIQLTSRIVRPICLLQQPQIPRSKSGCTLNANLAQNMKAEDKKNYCHSSHTRCLLSLRTGRRETLALGL